MRVLSDIEAILDTDPQTARARLDSIDAGILTGQPLALYAMLKTQADYKCYVDIPDDSLIRIATDWYGTRRKDWRAAMSWYSLGCVSDLNGNELDALDAYLKAMSMFPDTTVRYYALCQQNTGNIYLHRNMPDEAETILQQCLSHPACTEHGKMYFSVSYNLALNALYSGDYVRADSMFSTLLQDTLLPEYYRTDAPLQFAKIQFYGKGNYLKAIELCDSNITGRTSRPSAAALSIKADSYCALQEYDSAYCYYNESLESSNDMFTKCEDSRKLTELSIRLDNADNAMRYLELYNSLRDSIYMHDKSRELSEIIQRQRMESYERDARIRQTVYGGISVFLLVICLLTILFLYETKKKKLYRQKAALQEMLLHRQEELMRQEEELHRKSIAELSSKVRAISADNPAARGIMLELYAQQLTECRLRFMSTDAGKRLLAVRTGIGSLTAADIDTIWHQLSESYSDIIKDIYIEVPNINQNEVQTLILQSLNCSNDLIAALDTKVTAEGIHKRRYRLQGKCGSQFYNLFLPQNIDN